MAKGGIAGVPADITTAVLAAVEQGAGYIQPVEGGLEWLRLNLFVLKLHLLGKYPSNSQYDPVLPNATSSLEERDYLLRLINL